MRLGINTKNRHILIMLAVVISILFVYTCFRGRPLLLVNGHVLTMNASNSVAQSIFVDNSRIIAIGSNQHVLEALEQWFASKSWAERLLGYRHQDLLNKTVLPGFVDAHSHFPSSGLASAGLDLSSPPIGEIADTEQLLAAIAHAANHQSTGRWIVGFNYDDASLPEGKHPTRQQLDTVAPDHAVYLWHQSGHMGIANTKALRELGYDPGAVGLHQITIADGHIGRNSDGELSGLLQEHAAPGLRRLLQEIPWYRLPEVLLTARTEYLRAGVTTVQNGYADTILMRLLLWAQRFGIIRQRLVFWVAHDKLDKPIESATYLLPSARHLPQTLPTAMRWAETESEDFTISAIKLIADGSPQGRTAWLSEPYLPDARLGLNYAGLPTARQSDFLELVIGYHEAGFRLALHGNGDAAIDLIIHALTQAQLKNPRTDVRHTLVHAQTIRRDQLESLQALQVSVSFFPSHTFYWGDWYRHTVLGERRAAFISPLAAADEANLQYSMHSDAPVTPMQPMHMLWSATTRETRSGFTLGHDQIIGRERALRAMTIDAAWQAHLESSRGSLEAGKLADLIVLSANPLVVDDPRAVRVEQVYIGGRAQPLR